MSPEAETPDSQRKAVVSALRESLRDNPITWPPGESWRAGWLLVRRIKRLLIEHGLDPDTHDPAWFEKWAKRLAERNELDPEDTYERFYLAWGKNQFAEGQDPVTQAVALESANGNGSALSGNWPGVTFAADATRLYRVLARLAEMTGGVVFAPCRKFGEVLHVDPARVSTLLAALCRNHYIQKEGASGQGRAQRYRVLAIPRNGVCIDDSPIPF